MTDISLNPIKSGYNLQKINDNFEKIEENINEDIIHNVGGNNTMQQDFDLNNNKILNAPDPVDPLDVVRLKDLPEFPTSSEGMSIKESKTLTDGQVEITFDTIPTTASFYVSGTDADRGRLKLYVDYFISDGKIVLTNSFQAGTEITGIVNDPSDLMPAGVLSFNTREGHVLPESGDYTADQVGYDNTTSGLAATEVQGAVDEINTLVGQGDTNARDTARDEKATSGDNVQELEDFITPATVANEFSIPATVKYVDGLRISIPETLITLPAAPDGLDKLDGTGRYADLAAAITAGGNDLTQSVITRQDVVVYDVTNAQYVVHQGLREYSGMVDAMTAFSYTQDAKDKNLWRDALGNLFVMICHPQRLNQGGYHPEYNSSGCSFFWNADNVSDAGWLWHDSTAKKPANKSECFALSATNGTGNFVRADRGDIAGGVSGRPTNWNVRFYDAVTASQIHDVRAICNHKSKADMLTEFDRKGIADAITGSEAVPFLKKVGSFTVVAGDNSFGRCYGSGAEISDIYSQLGSPASGANTVPAFVYNETTGAMAWIGTIQDNNNLVILSTEILGETGTTDDTRARFIQNSIINYSSNGGAQSGNTALAFNGGTFSANTAALFPVGSVNYVLTYELVSAEFGTLPYQFLIAYPDRLAATFPDGVYGQWLGLTAESVYPFTRKLEGDGTHTRVFTVDDGVNWAASSISPANFDTVKNELDLTGSDYTANHVAIHQFNTSANPYELANNAEVVGEIGNMHYGAYYNASVWGDFQSHLLGKIAVSTDDNINISKVLEDYQIRPWSNDTLGIGSQYAPKHSTISVSNPNSPAMKAFPYITSENGQYFLQWVYKEMYWDAGRGDTSDFIVITGADTSLKSSGGYYFVTVSSTGRNGAWRCVQSTSVAIDDPTWTTLTDGSLAAGNGSVYFKRWDGNGFGDNNKFTIIDGEGTEPDENGNTVLVGQKRTPLPYFTGE